MKKMLKVLFAILIMGTTVCSSAQNSPEQSLGENQKGEIRIAGGIGGGLLGLTTYGFLNFNATSYETGTTPVTLFAIDYFLTDKSSFGIGYAYQSVTGTYSYPSPPITFGMGASPSYPSGNVPNVNEYINRAIIYLHYSRYSKVWKRQQLYCSANIGLAIYHDDVVNSNPASNNDFIGQPIMGKSKIIYGSFQISGGYLFCLTKSIGFHLSIGIGVDQPYVASAGITYTFKTRNKI